MSLPHIKKYLDIRFEKHKKDWDTVGCIIGDEGVSKSTLAQHMIDYWMTKRNGECKPEDIKHIGMTGADFINDLSDCVQNEMTVFDEAGELDSRRAMSKFNVMITQAYKVIRADRLFTILVLPDFWDLEPRFRNRRLKFLIHVSRRGHCAFWLKDKVRKICALNEGRLIKNPYLVQPDFWDDFPVYDGPIAEEYKKMKSEKTKETRKKLKLTINGKTVKQLDEKKIKLKALMDINYPKEEIAKYLDVGRSRVNQMIREINQTENESE